VDEQDQAREIRESMAALRRDLQRGVESVSESARVMTDWRYYVRQFPFATAAVAAAVGYLLIPRRPQVIVPDAQTLAKMARNNQVWVKTGAPKSSEGPRGMLAGLVALAAGALGRAAVAWVGEQMKSSLSPANMPGDLPTTDDFEPSPDRQRRVPR
jgi:hypothetical protein